MAWRIELTTTAVKQRGKLDKGEAKRITSFLRERPALADDLRSTGRALTGPAVGAYWRYRVGNYRIICNIQDGVLCILVIEVESVIKPEVPTSAYCGILEDYDLGDIEPPKEKDRHAPDWRLLEFDHARGQIPVKFVARNN